MNKKLIKKLTEKWSSPDGMPAKGSALAEGGMGLSPCAQSEAVMLSKGIGVVDFKAFLEGSLSKSYNDWGGNLDQVTAKALGISVIHAILLRRFNDLSSLNPAIPLNEPEKVLGKNWEKVLEFWHFVESLSQEKLGELGKLVESMSKSVEYRSRKVDLKLLTEGLDVIVPDLYFKSLGLCGYLDPSTYVKKTVEEMHLSPPSPEDQTGPKIIHNNPPLMNEVVGDYSRAYFGWIAPYDYFLSNNFALPFLCQHSLKFLFACATNEIQTLDENSCYDNLYFCGIIGYDPFENHTLKVIKRKIREYVGSFLRYLNRAHRIVDNTIFSAINKTDVVNQSLYGTLGKFTIRLTENDILQDRAYDKIIGAFVGKKGSLVVPKLGCESRANQEFFKLMHRLKTDFSMYPLSYHGGKDKGSRWAIIPRNTSRG